MKTIKPRILTAAISALLLSSCGGSSDSLPPLEGAFAGKLSNDVVVTDLVLDDGSIWAIYGAFDGGIQGFSHGRVDSDNGKFTVSFTDYLAPGDNIAAGSGSGVYTRSSARGSITTRGDTLTFNVSTIPEANYSYHSRAAVSSLVGQWSGEFLDGDEATIHILADGMFSGETEDGCQFNGKFTPKSDVNVFDINLVFGGTPCAFPNLTANGIGLTIVNDHLENNLIMAGVAQPLNVGSIFVAARS